MKAFDDFLDGYCRKHKITRAVAESHALVKEVEAYYEAVELEERKNHDESNNSGSSEHTNIHDCLNY